MSDEFIVYIGGNGKVDSQKLTEELELLAEEQLQYFHDFLSGASNGNENSIDWWTARFSSRNCFTSPLFFNLLSISFVKRLIDAGKPLVINTDSFFLFLIYKKLYKKKRVKGAEVKWVPIYKKLLKQQVKFFSVIMLSLPLFIFNRIIGKSYFNKSTPNERINLFSCFATPVWWSNDTDRYFPGLTSYYSSKRLESVYFLPRVIGNRGWLGLRKENQQYRNGEKNVLILEDYITIKDCIYSWAHWVRIFLIKPKNLFWDGVDVGMLYYKEVMSPYSILGSMKSILYYRFFKNLSDRNVNIRSFTNFFENQVVDKALHKGVRDFFPMAKNIGYEGYSPVTHYYCSFPVQKEHDSGVLPDILALPGKGLQSYVDQFVNGIETVVVPHLRGSSIYDHLYYNRVTNDFKVLIALPHTASDWGYFLALASEIKKHYGDSVDVLLKPHPIVRRSYIYDIIAKYDCLEHVKVVSGDVFSLINQSRLLISSASGTLIESIALGVPVAVMRIPNTFMLNPIPPIVPKSQWVECNNVGALFQYIDKLFYESQEEYRDRVKLSAYVLSLLYEPVSKSALCKMLES